MDRDNRPFWDENIERMPAEKLRELQSARLRTTIKRAMMSEFYRSGFKDAGVDPDGIKGIEDLSYLPIISKTDFRKSIEQHPPFGNYTCVPMSDVMHVHTTSGTTGNPTAILMSRNDVELIAERAARGFWSQGVRPHDIVQCAYTYQFFAGAWAVHWGYIKAGASVIPAGGGNTERQLKTMRTFGTTVFAATPSYCLYVAETAPKYGVEIKKDLKVRSLFMSGEPGASMPSVRKKVEGAWGAKGYDGPGSSEALIWSLTCSEQTGCHVAEDHFIMEVLDLETKKPVAPGQQGVAVITTLGIEAQPLIRWWTDDLVVYTDEPCPCGRTHRLLPHGLMGRVDHMMKVSGVRIWPTAIESTLRAVDGVGEEFRILVDDTNCTETGMECVLRKLKLRVEKQAGMENDDLLAEKVVSSFKTAFNINPDVEIVPPGTYCRFEFKANRIEDLRTKK